MTFREWLFRIVAAASLVIAAYHMFAIFYPINSSPPWRHAVFVVVCLICAIGFVKRTKLFIYFFSALLVQQSFSHGRSLVIQWRDYSRIDWVSFLLLIFMPFILINLFIDWFKKGKLNS